MSEVLGIFAATLMGFTLLEPVHLLWINLITDCFPALALGMEKAEPDVMRRPPRKATDGIFSGGVGVDIAYQGVLVTIITLAAYFIGHFMESGVWEIAQSADGMTMAFLAMIFGTRFAALLNKGQQRHGLPEKERRQRNRSGAVFALCLCAVFGLAWLAVHLFQAG